MNRLTAGGLGGINNALHLQIGICRRGVANVYGMVCHLNVQGTTVCIGEDSNRLDA